MNVGFGLYGVLMIFAAVQTYRHARARRWEAHRACAMRLFALATGSWLYRMDYGLWLTAAPDHIWRRPDFHGPFEVVMAFFYVPNLVIAELFLRARRGVARPALRIAARPPL
jgi:hypothetical protein